MENHTPAQALSSSIIRDSSSLRDCPAPRDVVWIAAEKEALDRNEELLGRCLVGFWEGDSNCLLDLASFGSWAKSSWFLEGNLWLSNVTENLLLLEFEFADETERVFQSGARRFRGRSFCLEKWKPSVGCFEGDRGDLALFGSEFLASLCIFGEEVSSESLETLAGGLWLWMKTQPSVGTSSGPESSLKSESGSTQVRCRLQLVPFALPCSSGGKTRLASPLCSSLMEPVLGSLRKARRPCHALRGE